MDNYFEPYTAEELTKITEKYKADGMTVFGDKCISVPYDQDEIIDSDVNLHTADINERGIYFMPTYAIDSHGMKFEVEGGI